MNIWIDRLMQLLSTACAHIGNSKRIRQKLNSRDAMLKRQPWFGSKYESIKLAAGSKEKKIGFSGHYSLSNRLIQPKGDKGISTLNQTISRCEPARIRTQNHLEVNQNLNASNVQLRDFSPKLHKLAINDARFKCCIKSCSYVDKFKLMLRHLREGIGLIQN